MLRHSLLALPAAAFLSLPAFVRPATEASTQQFAEVLDVADRAFSNKDYLTSVESLQQGIRIANATLREALLAAMPVPPDGFVELDRTPPQIAPNDPIAAALSLRTNAPVVLQYRARQDNAALRVLIAPRSPTVGAVARSIALASEDPASELVTIGPRVGVVRQLTASFTIRFALDSVHLVELAGHGIDPKVALMRFDEAFFDRLSKILGG